MHCYRCVSWAMHLEKYILQKKMSKLQESSVINGYFDFYACNNTANNSLASNICRKGDKNHPHDLVRVDGKWSQIQLTVHHKILQGGYRHKTFRWVAVYSLCHHLILLCPMSKHRLQSQWMRLWNQLNSVSSQCARGKSSIAWKPEDHPKNIKW